MKVKVCLGLCAVLVTSVAFGQQTQQQKPPDEKAMMDAMTLTPMSLWRALIM